MNRIRLAALSALLVCAVSLGLAGTASAAQTATTPLTKKVAITGTKGFKGTYTIDRFTTRNGKMVAVGTLKGTIRKRGATLSVRRKNVVMPASVAGAGPSNGASAAQVPPTPGACQVLNLQLGPINLNLLGLLVRTNEIDLRIEAQPGAGNLLGNLLCGITNLLNPNGALNNLTAALNAILALVPKNPTG